MAVAVEPSTTRRVVTAVEFAVLWACLGLGPTPVALRLASPGRTDGGRHAVHAAGWAALRAQGLAGPAGPDPELARLVRLLAGPAAQMELRGSWDRPVRAVAAGATDAGVLALRQDATVVLEGCGRLPDALAAVLPLARAGPGCPVTVAGVAPADVGSGPGAAAALAGGGAPRIAAMALARTLAEVRGRAQVVGFVADRAGVLRRRGGVLTIVDTARGRYLVTRDAADRCTVAPAGEPAVRRRVAELLSAG